MRRFVPLLAAVLTACSTGSSPPVQMRIVDADDGRPVAGASVTFCGEAWEGTFTGHGGRTQVLFRIEATTDANGSFSLAPQEFDSQPFGMSTNYDHAKLLVSKPGYELHKLINCCSALGNIDAVTKWGYNGTSVRLKRSPPDSKPRRNPFAADCGGFTAMQDPRTGQLAPATPPVPVRAPQDPAQRNQRAAQPATGER